MNMQRCNFCVMDTTDPDINFDETGRCNHCLTPINIASRQSFSYQADWVNQVKKERSKSISKFDAIVGVSGGVDSSYLVHYLQQYDLKLLLLHVDAGWNSSIATMNIRKLVEALDLELSVIVIDWNQMKDLQLAYLKSGVMNQDVPQDHIFFATLYSQAKKLGIKNIITGTNSATESIRVQSWSHDAMDGRSLKQIYRKYGTNEILNNLPFITYPRHYYETYVRKTYRTIRPLEQIDYSKKNALKLLGDLYGWEDYGGKHRESMFTKYFQDVYLVDRYGVDKRIIHLSDLIINGELTRKEALSELAKPASSDLEKKNLNRFVASKLGISENEMRNLLQLPKKSYEDFPNDKWFLKSITVISKFIKKLGIKKKFLK